MTGICEKQVVNQDNQDNIKNNIVVLSAFYEPFMSGAEQMVKEIAVRLSDIHKITIVTGRFDKKLLKRELKSNYSIVRVGFGHKTIDKLIYPLLAAFQVRKIKPDIAHAVMESYAGGALVLIKYLYPKAVRILTLQSGDLDTARKQRKLLVRFFWNLIHKTPHHITAISNFLAQRVVNMGVPQDRIRVIPNGVDLSEIPSANQRVQKRVICVARLSWEKGLDLLIKAWPEVVRKDSDAKLVLVGEGEQRKELEKQIQALKIADSVQLLGRLPHNEVLTEMSKSEIFICPSLAEGLGNVFIEAQACGLPVIGTKVGGIPDIIEDNNNGILIEANNIEAISNAIIRLLHDAELRGRLSKAAIESVSKFDWKIIIEAFNKIYINPKKLNILIATGVYPPDIGGPATFAKTLGQELTKRDVNVSILTFGDEDEKAGNIEKISRRNHVIIRYLRFVSRIFHLSKNIDVLYSFDLVSTGLPCVFVKLFKPRLKLVCRLGGDFQWEKAVNNGKIATLEEYYKNKSFSFSEQIIYLITKLVLNKSDKLIFNSNILMEIYTQYRNIQDAKCYIVKNIEPKMNVRPELKLSNNDKIRILFAGRMIKVRNLEKLLDAFKILKKSSDWPKRISLELVGEGPEKEKIEKKIQNENFTDVSLVPKMNRLELLEKIDSSDIIALISITEINSNFVEESLALGKPVVLTKYTEHFYNKNKQQIYFVDPMDVSSVVRGLSSAVSDVVAGKHFERINLESWDINRVINEHLKIFYEYN